jgi:thiosulfate/3-mercaptopyruvate sulfurtransferase
MKLTKLFFLVIALFVVSAISAQDVISANELAKISKKKDVVVVWAGAKDGYKVHITGSVNVPHSSLCNNEPVKTMLKPTAEMAKMLGEKGISTDKTIVVYDEGSGKYSGRMYWILKYLGAPNVKMLNGNLKAWKAGRKPITGSPTKSTASTFTFKTDDAQLAKMDEVKKATVNSSYVVVDARTEPEFSGSAETELRKGHIPGAVNVNHETLLDKKGVLKPNDQLKSLFESKGITSDKTVITYCESSVRAGIVYLALKGLGYPNVKVYDGAYLEWQATSSNKVE